MKNFGFSLAEVLITLTIVGIVSAIVVPPLVASYENQAYATTLHKAYNNINHTIEQYMAAQRVDNLAESEITSSAGLNNFIQKYFKAVTTCQAGSNSDNSKPLEGCFAIKQNKPSNRNTAYCYYYNLSKSVNIDCQAAIKTIDGISYCFNILSDNPNVIGIKVDLNGPDEPNMLGRDFFDGIEIDKNGQITTDNTDGGNLVRGIIEKNWKIDY